MNYEKKYLKYKKKYLQLKNIQLGGLIVEWPANISEIKPGDKVKVTNVELINGVNQSDTIDIKRVKEEPKYLTVISVSNTELLLQNENGQNFYFHTNIFIKVVLETQGEGPVYRPDMDSEENHREFTHAIKATTYDNLLLDGRISNADVRSMYGQSSALHDIPKYKNYDTDMLLYYILTCDPPADVNGRSSGGRTPMWVAALYNNTSAVKVLIDFGGDRTIKSNSNEVYPNTTPLDVAKRKDNQETIKLLTECFPSEE